jgi:hypothetical protein
VETVGVEPTPPRCKRGALPPDIPKARTDGVEPPQPEAPRLQRGELTRAQRPRKRGVADRIRTDASGITTPGASRYTTATMYYGSDRIRTGTLSPDKRALCSALSYASKLRGWDSNPRSRAHEAREDGPSSTALGLTGRSRTCDLRFPKPAGWPASPTVRGIPPAGLEPAHPG